MKLRLHLVRFMYINLILSCCFWLYDNAAAADVLSADALPTAAAAAADYAEQIPPAPAASLESANDLDRNFKKLNKFTADPPAAVIATTTSPIQDADSAASSYNSVTAPPRTSAKTKLAAVVSEEDTSVKTKVLPCSVNNNLNNNNNQYNNDILPNHNPKKNKYADKLEASNEVPKNQLSDKSNENQANNVVDPVKPKTGGEQKETKEIIPEIISELPGITITELPLGFESLKDTADAPTILHGAPNGSDNKSVKQPQQKESFEDAKEAVQNDETMNDPGGGAGAGAVGELDAPTFDAKSIANEDGNVTSNGFLSPELDTAHAVAAGNATATDEIPMPVFSEWAQKQMEAEASREQAMELEQQVVNNSAQRRNATGSGSGKVPSLKLRAKNYASPDCGAKIIASNGDATNTGAVLSHSSDEYMLSTCGNRIWFVVELCEAVQAQKVELANFELFSSSPKNFTVAVSKRFPTRDWSNVGRFTAEDKRTVQTFELYPHLFGKFVRVDIHSHYSKEHFCPISLFRVFGTSEFEAFETEIRHSDEDDDFDDDFAEQAQKQSVGSGGGANIFQSASDAVIQMVKKAAQVLVKPTKALRWSSDSMLCRTPATGIYSCPNCNKTTVERINNLLSCQTQHLQLLLTLPQLRAQMLLTRVCQADYDINLGMTKLETHTTSGMDKRKSFFLSILPVEHVGALCKLLQAEYSIVVNSTVESLEAERQLNISVLDQPAENVTTPVLTPMEAQSETMPETMPYDSPSSSPAITATLEKPPAEMPSTIDLPELEIHLNAQTKQTSSQTTPPTPADVNIFNVPSDTQEMPTPDIPTTTTSATLADNSPPPTLASPVNAVELEAESATPSSTATAPPTAAAAAAAGESGNGELVVDTANGIDDSHLANWESIDSLLTTTVASITAGGGAAAAAAAVVNGNANLGGTANAAGGINLQTKLTHSAQSESVFIRLSNRIKALERNMSLSGQYLEELSRRYKKQVEELQQTLTQQMLTVRTLEDQSRRYMEQEQLYKQQSAELAGEMRALTYQVQACILVIIIVGTCIFLMLVVGTVYYRKLRRQTQQLRPQLTPNSIKQSLVRRKSYEQMIDHSLDKKRRPSEEAMLILNGCGDIPLVEPPQASSSSSGTRRRKISVCYGSNNNIALNMFNARTSLLRHRKGKKHTSLDSAQVEPSKQLDMFFDVDTLKSNKPHKSERKKSQQDLKRQKSAPEESYTNGGSQAEGENTQSDFDESLILDDDDLANFIPNSDLAYNEFMPDGPSGYQIVEGKTTEKSQTAKKSRRVSSPAFFKSPFGKNKNKGGNINGALGSSKNFQSAHEATSWEWCRLKRADKQSKETSSVPSATDSPNGTQDNLSLSEINFPANSNSFRILGETIFSANDSKSHSKSIATGNSSSSSGASTTSSTTKKKQRAFNNIFRKVF